MVSKLFWGKQIPRKVVFGVGLYTIGNPIFDYFYSPIKHNISAPEFSIEKYGAGTHAVITGATSATGRAFSARL
jgi:hypothetical protein